jgi:uncharacterized membrane protein
MPIHPVFVHFPIAFFFLEWLLLIFWAVKKDAAYRRFALLSFWLAYLAAWLAWATGFFGSGGWSDIFAAMNLTRHFYFATATLLFYTSRAVYLKWAGSRSDLQPSFQIFLSSLGVALIFATAFFGGRLVYS